MFHKKLILIILGLCGLSLILKFKAPAPIDLDPHSPALTSAYLQAIEMVYDLEPTLSTPTICLHGLEGLSSEEINDLLSKLTLPKTNLLLASFEELKAQGLIKDTVFENGTYIDVTTEILSPTSIELSPSKWHSTTQAVGYSKLIFENQNGSWQLITTGPSWKQ